MVNWSPETVPESPSVLRLIDAPVTCADPVTLEPLWPSFIITTPLPSTALSQTHSPTHCPVTLTEGLCGGAVAQLVATRAVIPIVNLAKMFMDILLFSVEVPATSSDATLGCGPDLLLDRQSAFGSARSRI